MLFHTALNAFGEQTGAEGGAGEGPPNARDLHSTLSVGCGPSAFPWCTEEACEFFPKASLGFSFWQCQEWQAVLRVWLVELSTGTLQAVTAFNQLCTIARSDCGWGSLLSPHPPFLSQREDPSTSFPRSHTQHTSDCSFAGAHPCAVTHPRLDTCCVAYTICSTWFLSLSLRYTHQAMLSVLLTHSHTRRERERTEISYKKRELSILQAPFIHTSYRSKDVQPPNVFTICRSSLTTRAVLI